MSSPSEIIRLAASEYGKPILLSKLTSSLKYTSAELATMLLRAEGRITHALNLPEVFQIRDNTLRIVDCAGLLRISELLEIEICPKFLDPNSPHWREDFFVVATLTRFGRIFPRDALRSGQSDATLADLIGHAFSSMFEQNKRRPIRTYRRESWTDFKIDGDVEPEDLTMPSVDGFVQRGLLLNRKNQFNAALSGAMSVLLPELRSGDLRQKLTVQRASLGPQHLQGKLWRNRTLPSRHAKWNDLYELSLELLQGFGLQYAGASPSQLPGYLLKTADAWEALLITAGRIGLPGWNVRKIGHYLGERMNFRRSAKPTSIIVTPDATATNPGGVTVLFDAKYKGRWDALESAGSPGIDAQDLYEAFVFMEATGTERILLFYPNAHGETGKTEVFERCAIKGREIVAAGFSISGISNPGGFGTLCESLGRAIRQLSGL